MRPDNLKGIDVLGERSLDRVPISFSHLVLFPSDRRDCLTFAVKL
jgi:hypothetical protein